MSHFPAAFFYPPDSFDFQDGQVMGRRVAGSLLIRAFGSSLLSGEELTFFTYGRQSSHLLQQLLEPVLASGSRVRVISSFPTVQVIEQLGALCIPDPALAYWSSLRTLSAHNSFSLIGLIHTICSEGVIRALGDILSSPIYPWDAIVCTSTAGQQVVAKVFEAKLNALTSRYPDLVAKTPRIGLPKLPVIPLPGPLDQPFSPGLSRSERRAHARSILSIDSEDFVVLYVGRLSFHSKCHPLSLYRAVEDLAKLHPEASITLIECGHHFNDAIADAYQELRLRFPSINFRLIGGINAATEFDKWMAYAAADVFTSPVDNLQETFGLSLLEAMYAGLPLVVSDWSGYRDLVQHGVNGFLVPTHDVLSSFASHDQIDISYALNQSDYDTMIGLRSLGVAVDHSAYVNALSSLLINVDQRLRMAGAAKSIFQQRFSPLAVSCAYRDLFAELSELRLSAPDVLSPEAKLPSFSPSHSNLFGHFSSHPYAALDTAWFVADRNLIELLSSDMNGLLVSSLLGVNVSRLQGFLMSVDQFSLPELMSSGFAEDQLPYVLALLVKLGIVSQNASKSTAI